MLACVDRGLAQSGQLPGGLKVTRRAKAIHDRLTEASKRNFHPPHEIMDFVSVYAMAVNEENAAGGRVVTAPTNGAAGVIPAVLRYYRDHCAGATRAAMADFLMTATAIGALFKLNASISGAEVGCQGEVGVASSMAAAGLCAALGGANEQIENAAEIAMEHHLGMTCDPVGGLVQSRASSATPSVRSRRSPQRRSHCTATGRTASRWTASSPRCARPAPTCSRSTRRRVSAASRSISSSAEGGRGPDLESLGGCPRTAKRVRIQGLEKLGFP